MKVRMGPPGGTLLDYGTSNVELLGVTPFDSDLGNQIVNASLIVDSEKGPVPADPVEGMELQILDDDNVTVLYGGFVRSKQHIPLPTVKAWSIDCQSYAIRMFEGHTGTLTFVGANYTDRALVIAIVRAALKAVSFGISGAAVTDPIVTANEPNWPGVQGTAFIAGMSLSSLTGKGAMDVITRAVPGVYWAIDHGTKQFNYGPMRTAAPFALWSNVTPPAGTATIKPFEEYTEQKLVGDHRNKMTRGGAGGSSATAFDEVSYARYSRVFEDPYWSDITVPASDLLRRTYAELRSRRVRTVATCTVRSAGLRAGQIIDVRADRIGSGTRPAPFPKSFSGQIFGRSSYGILAGERGHFLIQKVHRLPLARGGVSTYEITLGDNVRDFTTGIAVLAGSGT